MTPVATSAAQTRLCPTQWEDRNTENTKCVVHFLVSHWAGAHWTRYWGQSSSAFDVIISKDTAIHSHYIGKNERALTMCSSFLAVGVPFSDGFPEYFSQILSMNSTTYIVIGTVVLIIIVVAIVLGVTKPWKKPATTTSTLKASTSTKVGQTAVAQNSTQNSTTSTENATTSTENAATSFFASTAPLNVPVDLQHKNSGLYMHPAGGWAQNGVLEEWWHIVGDNTQFLFNPNGTISNKKDPSLCLHPTSGGSTPENGQRVGWYPDCQADHAKFTLKDNGLYHDKSGKCLVPNGEPLSGSAVIFWSDCGAHPIVKVENAKDIERIDIPSKIQYGSGEFFVHPANVKLNRYDQQFLRLKDHQVDYDGLIFNENGSIALKSNPKLCIHPEDGRGGNNSELQWWPDCNAEQAKFDIGRKPGPWKHRMSGRCVHPRDGVAQNDKRLVTYDGCDHKWSKK